jgi:hypothetical protein
MPSFGNIAAQFGVPSSVNCGAIYTNPFTRTGAPYRVNPFAIHNGLAPAEYVAPHSFGHFLNYNHSALNLGDNLADVLAYGGELTLNWDHSPGFNASVCRYRVSAKSTGTVPVTNTNPLVSPDAQQYTTSNTITLSALTIGHWYACSVEVEFDDNTNLYLSTGFPGSVATTELEGATIGILTSDKLPANAPTMGAATQPVPAESCTDFESLELHLDFTSFGPSAMTIEASVNSGAYQEVRNNVAAGSTLQVFTGSESWLSNGVFVRFRIRYNSVSPTVWSATSNNLFFQCGDL